MVITGRKKYKIEFKVISTAKTAKLSFAGCSNWRRLKKLVINKSSGDEVKVGKFILINRGESYMLIYEPVVVNATYEIELDSGTKEFFCLLLEKSAKGKVLVYFNNKMFEASLGVTEKDFHLFRPAPPVPKPKKIKKVKIQERKFLSVIVGVKDRAGWRAKNFFESLSIQNDKNFEVIVIDYGSSSRKRKELMELTLKYGFRYYYVNEDVWNRSKAFNIGISKSRGDYIMTTDIDLIFEQSFIANVRKIMNPLRFIWTVPIFLEKKATKGPILKTIVLPQHFDFVCEGYRGKTLRPCRGTIQCTTAEWFYKVNGYDERMYGYTAMDQDMWIRARAYGLETYKLIESRCVHQWHSRSIQPRKTKFRHLVGDRIVKKGWKIPRFRDREKTTKAGTHHKFLSVVIGVKNRTGIRADNCLKSLYTQTDKNFEIILVDWGSTENHQKEYRDLCKKYGARYYYVDKDGWNRPKSLNVGIAKAWGDYVMTTDIDMVFKPDFIQELRKVARPNRFIWTIPIFLNKKFTPERFSKHIPNNYLIVVHNGLRQQGKSYGTIQCARRSWWLEIGGYDERMKDYCPEDQDVFKRARKYKLKMYRMIESSCAHQSHGCSPWKRHKMEYRPLIGDSIKKGEIKEEILVTIVVPVVYRAKTAKRTIEALLRYANFPKKFIIIVNPKLKGLIHWIKALSMELGIEMKVIEEIISPMVMMKHESVEMTKTKYLLMMDCDMLVSEPMRPMLHFLETHPKVGVCAVSLRGGRHKILSHGADLSFEDGFLKIIPRLKKSRWHKCDYIHNACTFFRKEMFEEGKVHYDIKYKGQGWAHEDFFMQMKEITNWDIVSWNDVFAKTLADEHPPVEYYTLRRMGIKDNERRFRRKWHIREIKLA